MIVPEWTITITMILLSIVIMRIGLIVSKKVNKESNEDGRYWLGVLFGVITMAIIVGITEALEAFQ